MFRHLGKFRLMIFKHSIDINPNVAYVALTRLYDCVRDWQWGMSLQMQPPFE